MSGCFTKCMAPEPRGRLAETIRFMRKPSATTTASRCEVQPGIWLDSRRAVWFASERLLAIADLHWGYAASHRARGNLLPVWGDDEIEARLASLVRDYAPAEMLWLGDIVHAAEGDAAVLRHLEASPVKITLLAGNHDRRWTRVIERTATRGRFFFHHGDMEQETPAGHVAVVGHHHPAVVLGDGAGGKVKLPALVAGRDRLVLPAFSPWAAGADCSRLAGPDATVWAIAPTRIFALPDFSRTSAAV